MAKYTSDDKVYYKGYVKGKWIDMYYTEEEVSGGIHCYYYYKKSGKKVEYHGFYLR